jgi:hypothetical protein
LLVVAGKGKARKSKRKQQKKDENFDQDTPLTGNIRKSKHIKKKQKETKRKSCQQATALNIW